MVGRSASAPWTVRIDAGPWELEAPPSYSTLKEKPLRSSFLLKGIPRNSLYSSLLLPKHTQVRFYERRQVVASVKNDDAATPVHSSELFELARKKVATPYLSAREGQLPSGALKRATFSRTYPLGGRDPGSGLFHSGRGLSHFQAATQKRSAQFEQKFKTHVHSWLQNLKKVCDNAYHRGVATLEATPLAPLLPYSGYLLVIVAFALTLGLIIGRLIGRVSTQGLEMSNVGNSDVVTSSKPIAPTGIAVFLEGDMKKKESVEWVNMVLGKLWKVYRLGLENWLVGLLQPLIDNLQKPDYVSRVQINRFDLGDEPIAIRSVERRTSRRANDLQYHIGLRYAGTARMMILLKLRAGFIPVAIPVGVRGLDVDGELWVKLRLVPGEPWVGTATWAFVSLPKIKLDLSPFRLFNLMAIPFLSIFLTKLLTEDLPRLFVRPNKNVVDFLQGRAVGPVPKDFKGATTERNKDFTGELSVTLVDAKRLRYAPFGKTDPYVNLILGDQVIRSKKNSQTSVIGPPGNPIWNQDFQLLVVDHKTQRLDVRVRDFFGLTAFTVGFGEVELISLRDTVPVDKHVRLRGGWGPFRRRFAGEILLRLTYTAYIDDEEEDIKKDAPLPSPSSPISVAEGTTESLPLIKEVITTVVENVQAEDSVVNGMVTSLFSNESGDGTPTKAEWYDPEGLEVDKKSGDVAIKVPVKEGKNKQATPAADQRNVKEGKNKQATPAAAAAADQQNSNGRTLLLWLGVATLLSIFFTLSLNFLSLMNP